MNKYLISFLLFCVCFSVRAEIPAVYSHGQKIVQINNGGTFDFNEIKNTVADKYDFADSVVIIDNFSDWQNWNANVEWGSGVHLYVNNMDVSDDGEIINHVKATSFNQPNVTVKDTGNLYKTGLRVQSSSKVFLTSVRETNYKKVFNDSRGTLLENIRQNNPNDKMLSVMDRARNMQEINSVMNSAYHFKPIILMNPVKTVNRSAMLNFLTDEEDIGIGANIDYLGADKFNNFGGHLYIADKYDDSYIKISLNFNRFDYSDDFNDFDGLSYGIDLRAKQYINKIWLDGILGINQTAFNADNVYDNGNILNNPKGMSEYARLSFGYDYTKFDSLILSPFVGFLLQNTDIVGNRDADINLHGGLIGKYKFIMDGIRYEYGAFAATDEKANWNAGANIGFMSLADYAGANFGINMFKDEFGINYKFTIKAKLSF